MTKEEKNDLIFFYEDDCDVIKSSLKFYDVSLIIDLIKIKLKILSIKLFWKNKKFVV